MLPIRANTFAIQYPKKEKSQMVCPFLKLRTFWHKEQYLFFSPLYYPHGIFGHLWQTI